MYAITDRRNDLMNGRKEIGENNFLSEEEEKYISEAAAAAGAYIRSIRPAEEEISGKEGRGNFVTFHDKYVQSMLYEKLRAKFPGCSFLGEEDDTDSRNLTDLCFIIDPIDGTKNFINGMRRSAVSIACEKNGSVVFGAVCDPYLDELFTAGRNGAFVNGSLIHISGKKLEESIIMFGSSPYYPDKTKRSVEILGALMERAYDVRRSGSAALDLCYVACGRADIFFELVLSPWDYAAAGYIIKRAGGVIMTCEGREVSLRERSSVAAASEEVCGQIMRIFREIS